MASTAWRRGLWILVVLLMAGAGLYYVTRQLSGLPTQTWAEATLSLMQTRQILLQHGVWLHPLIHGITYLYLIWRWPDVIAWINRRREARGFPPMSQREGEYMAMNLIVVIVLFEILLLLRHLG